jgi:DNA replication protein DnaC
MNVPPEFRSVRTDLFPPLVREKMVNYMKNLRNAKDMGVGLWVTGGLGVGKTSIAVAIARIATMQGITSYFTTVAGYRESIRARLLFDSDMTVVERAHDVGVLVLDDFCTGDLTEHFLGERELEQLISMRGSRRKITVVTVNRLSAQEVGALALSVKTSRYMQQVHVDGENRNTRIKEAARELFKPRAGK